MSRKSALFTLISSIFLVGCSAAAPPLASSREATPASFNTAPATEPVRMPTTALTDLANEFDAQLLAQLKGGPATSPAAPLPADERQLIAAVMDAIAQFRHALRGNNTTMAARVAPLLELSDRIRAQTPLNLPTLAICKSVKQFGTFDEIAPARFPAGRETTTIVYCEVENFASKEADPGRWETKLSYQAELFSSENVQRSSPVLSKEPANVLDECRNRRRDFFLADRLTIPANLPVGHYVLKVTVIDQLANRVAEKTVSITIEPS